MCIAVAAFGAAYGQNLRYFEFQGGTLNPKGTRAAGLILSAGYGICVDERVDLGLGISMFHKGFTEKTEVASSTTLPGSEVKTVIMPLEYSTTLLPVGANATVHIPFQPPLGIHVGGSLVYEFLFDKYTNHETKQTEKSRFSGFGWMARAGFDLAIGSRSSLSAEAFYNGCKVKGNKKEIEGIPTWDEVDVSGLGFRAGLRVELY
jgi:hypothetical protein